MLKRSKSLLYIGKFGWVFRWEENQYGFWNLLLNQCGSRFCWLPYITKSIICFPSCTIPKLYLSLFFSFGFALYFIEFWCHIEPHCTLSRVPCQRSPKPLVTTSQFYMNTIVISIKMQRPLKKIHRFFSIVLLLGWVLLWWARRTFTIDVFCIISN